MSIMLHNSKLEEHQVPVCATTDISKQISSNELHIQTPHDGQELSSIIENYKNNNVNCY